MKPFSIDLPVSNPAQQCHSCGGCCTVIPMNASPAELRRKIEAGASEQSPAWYEARQILRALGGTCSSKLIQDNGVTRYLYGPCRNLVQEEGGKPLCAIHDIKPKMCWTYPWYAQRTPLGDRYEPLPDNIGYIKGCGYNTDPSFGSTPEQLRAMAIPLEEHEL